MSIQIHIRSMFHFHKFVNSKIGNYNLRNALSGRRKSDIRRLNSSPAFLFFTQEKSAGLSSSIATNRRQGGRGGNVAMRRMRNEPRIDLWKRVRTVYTRSHAVLGVRA